MPPGQDYCKQSPGKGLQTGHEKGDRLSGHPESKYIHELQGKGTLGEVFSDLQWKTRVLAEKKRYRNFVATRYCQGTNLLAKCTSY